MIKIMLSIFFTINSLCLSSGNRDRRLLQAAAVVEPVTPSEVIPNTGGSNTGTEPSPSTGVVEPVVEPAAVEPVAVEPAAPIEATTPNTNTGNTNTGNTNPLPWTSQQSAPGAIEINDKTECRITPPHPDSCAQRPITIYDPNENWELQCNAVGAMFESQVTIDIPPTSQLAEIQGMWFTEPYCGASATITINNPTGRRIGIAAVHATEAFACKDMTIYTGPDVFIQAGNFWCDPQKQGSCDNCWVKENAADPGLPCTAYA